MPIIVPSSFSAPATSGTYFFTVNRDQIIRQALLNIGKLDEDDPIEPVVLQDMALLLNMMIKQWQGHSDFAPGVKVWTRKRGYLFLSNETGQYALGPNATGWTNDPLLTNTTASAAALATTLKIPSGLTIQPNWALGIVLDDNTLWWSTVSSYSSTTLVINDAIPSIAGSGAQVFAYETPATQPVQIETATLRDNTLNDVPLRILRTVQDYDLLPQKSNPGNVSDPGAIYYEYQLWNSNLYTDVGAAQDTTKYLVLTYLEAVQDFNNPGDAPCYPQEMYLTLCWGLAKLAAPQYNRPWTPLQETNWALAMKFGQKKDPELSTMYFQPGADD